MVSRGYLFSRGLSCSTRSQSAAQADQSHEPRLKVEEQPNILHPASTHYHPALDTMDTDPIPSTSSTTGIDEKSLSADAAHSAYISESKTSVANMDIRSLSGAMGFQNVPEGSMGVLIDHPDEKAAPPGTPLQQGATNSTAPQDLPQGLSQQAPSSDNPSSDIQMNDEGPNDMQLNISHALLYLDNVKAQFEDKPSVRR